MEFLKCCLKELWLLITCFIHHFLHHSDKILNDLFLSILNDFSHCDCSILLHQIEYVELFLICSDSLDLNRLQMRILHKLHLTSKSSYAFQDDEDIYQALFLNPIIQAFFALETLLLLVILSHTTVHWLLNLKDFCSFLSHDYLYLRTQAYSHIHYFFHFFLSSYYLFLPTWSCSFYIFI